MVHFVPSLRCAALLALAGIPGGCSSTPPLAPDGLLIRNVTVLPMEGPERIAGQDVLIRNGRIAAIGRSGTIRGAPAEVIEGSGRFLMPALWDMHVHLTAREGERPSEVLSHYLAYGIAGVRDLGSALDDFGRMRAEVRARADLPEVVASGPLLDGPRQSWMPAVALALESVGDARDAAELIAEAGADFLKVYSNLSAEQHQAVADVARRRGLPFVGHVPFRMSVEQVSAAGQASIEHGGVQLIKDCVPEGNRAVSAVLQAWISGGFPGRYAEERRIRSSRDAAACRALYRRLAERGTYVTPTLVNDVKGSGWSWGEELDALPRDRQEECDRSLGSIDADPALRDAFAADQLDQVRELRNEGVPLLAGSDVPNDCLWHGVSLHRELELMVRAGLSPLEAIQTATRNPARFLGRVDEGTVRAGQVANLLLLDADPLADIANTRRIAGMALRGHWRDGRDLFRLQERPVTVYDNARVWTGQGFAHRWLAIRDGRFVAFDGDGPVAERIDLEGAFVIPAFGNAHAHLTSPNPRSSWSFLENGVFYVWNPNTVTLGSEARAFFARRDTVDIFLAMGGITEPGGHPERLYVDILTRHVYRGRTLDWFLGNAFHYGRTREEIDAALDRLVEQGADFVKIYLFSSEDYARRRADPAYRGFKGLNPINVPYIAAAAQARGLFVAAHVETVSDLRIAALSGIAVAAHLPLYDAVQTREGLGAGILSPADAALVARTSMRIVPTYAVATQGGIAHGPTDGTRASREEVYAAQALNIRRLLDAGAIFLIGTDTEGAIFEEAEHLVRIGALDTGDALSIVLATGSRMFPGRRIGCFAPGCEADFLVLSEDPRERIENLRSIVRRVKAGAELTPPAS